MSCVSMYLLWYGFPYVSMGLFSTITNIAPILTLVVGYLILKEKVSKIEVFNILISFSGVMFLVIFSNRPS